MSAKSESQLSVSLEGSYYHIYGVDPRSTEATIIESVGGRRKKSFYQVPAIDFIRRDVEAELDLDFPRVPERPVPPLLHLHPHWDKLHLWQQADIEDLVASPHRGRLLSWSPGLGKTVGAIVGANGLGAQKVTVVAPASLVFNWQREIGRWSVAGEWRVMSYQSAVRGGSPLWEGGDLLVLDESGMVRNRQTQRFQALKQARQRYDYLWLLSGSPIANYNDDLWAQFHLIAPWAFSSYWRFANRFCFVEEDVWGTKVVGSRRVQMQTTFSDLLISRNQQDVIDLPEFLQEVIELEMTTEQKRAYQRLERDFIVTLSEGGEEPVSSKMGQLVELQKMVSVAKHRAVIDLLETAEKPAIIWTHWLDNSKQLELNLMRDLPELRVSRVVGGDAEAGEQVARFQQGDLDILILSIEAMKFGHTLTAARTIIYVDRTFSGDAYYQSMLRVKRIGLTHSPVLYTLKFPGTTDSLIDLRLAGKMPSIASVTCHNLLELMRSLR